MKKTVFSLVAFMAFSVSAFANTIEVKEEVVVKDEIVKFEETKKLEAKSSLSLRLWFWLTKCDIIYIRMAAVALEEGFSKEQSHQIAMGAYSSCTTL